MDRPTFIAAYATWLASSAVLIAPNGFTYRIAVSIGGDVKRFVSGRLCVEVR